MPEKIIASYRIVTPMFIGDAEQNATGISPASVKGALRFWWRALNWARFRENNSDIDALRAIHTEEARLFGGLAETVEGEKRQSGGQGVFLLRVAPDKIKVLRPNELDENNSFSLTKHHWQSYLLGLGLMKYDNQTHQNYYQRSAIVSGSFSVQLYCKDSEYSEKLKTLLLLWGLLGGLGSRQRKGLGSISITELKSGDDNIPLPENSQEVIETLKKIIDKRTPDIPPYTAFSQSAKILCSPSNNNLPWQILEDVAKDMQLFRGWGFSRNGGNHLINRQPANHASYGYKKTDHDIVYQYLDKKVLHKLLPKSYTFGLPRSYVLSTLHRSEFKLDVLARDNNNREDSINKRSRRASPLFIHIHQFPNNDSMIIQSFLPSTFLPSQDLVQVKQKFGPSDWRVIDGGDIPVNPTTDWQVIEQYLKTFSTWDAV